MAFESYRIVFKGKLANIETSKLKTLDRSKTKLKDRKAFLKEKYKEVKIFYDEYVFNENYYKCNLNSRDNLSCDINIFKYIENDATYLLNSIDVAKEKGNRFSKRTDETSLEDYCNATEKNQDNYRLAPKDILKVKDFLPNELLSKGYSHYLKKWDENNVYKAYVEKKDRINKDKFVLKKITDYSTKNNKISYEQFERYKALDIKKIKVLKQQEEARIDLISLKLKLLNSTFEDEELEAKRKNYLRVTINAIRELKKDMIYTKKSFLPRVEIAPEKCSTALNLCEQIDYSNKNHIKNALLLIPSENISSDFNIIAYDIQKAIDILKKEKKLSSYELELIDLYRRTVSNMSTCSIELNKHKTQIYRDLDKIIDKILEKLNKK